MVEIQIRRSAHVQMTARSNLIKSAALLCLAVSSADCTMPGSSSPSRPPIVRVLEIKAHGADSSDAFCTDFQLSVSAAQQFFDRARSIDAAALHDQFEYLPCWVHGTGRDEGNHTVSWEIRAGGTATVLWPDGHSTTLGCRQCAAEFK